MGLDRGIKNTGFFDVPSNAGQQRTLAVHRHTNKIAFAPDQAAAAGGVEIVEGKIEVERQDLESGQVNTCSLIGNVANTTAMHAGLPAKEHERLPVDQRPPDRASFNGFLAKYLVKGQHSHHS
jgi:hypothetical protein